MKPSDLACFGRFAKILTFDFWGFWQAHSEHIAGAIFGLKRI